MLKVAQAAFVSKACRISMGTLVFVKWLNLPLTSRQQSWLMSLAMDLAALSDMYVEVKMAQMDDVRNS